MNGGSDRQRGPDSFPGHDLQTSRRPLAPTRREAVLGVAEELRAGGITDERLEAERLVAHAVGIDRSELVLRGSEPLTVAEADGLAEAMRRRLAREPLQHIEGSAAFRDLVLVSDDRALIPRPETEQLVDQVIRWARDRGPLARGLDIGTGSGAIALSLLSEGVVRQMIGVDVSAAALDQAAANRIRAGVRHEAFELRRTAGPIWSAVGPGERFDVIVSNPPYVRDDEITSLPPEVRDYEPREALAGGADGLDTMREIASGAPGHLTDGGALFVEIGEGQAGPVRRLFETESVWRKIDIERDLAGRERFLRATIG